MTNKTKHIVLLTPGFPKNEKDSTTIPALQIYVKALSKLDYNLTVITFQYPFISQKYYWNDVPIYPLNGKNKKYKKLIVWQKAKQLLKKINAHKKIDVIHSFWIGECSFIGNKFAQNFNVKHLVTAMGQDVLKPNIFAEFSNKNTQIITLSKRQQGFLKTNFDLESQIISWGIKPRNGEIKTKTIDILGVGSLNTIKNYDLFIDIIAILVQEFKNLNVEIIGNGKLKVQLQKKIEKKNLQKNIKIKGELSHSDVLLKMETAKILLHTSSYESFGMVFLEALNAAMHIVSFKVGFAENTEQWHTCNTKEEMVFFLKKCIETNFKTSRINHLTIEQTVINYSKLYDA